MVQVYPGCVPICTGCSGKSSPSQKIQHAGYGMFFALSTVDYINSNFGLLIFNIYFKGGGLSNAAMDAITDAQE